MTRKDFEMVANVLRDARVSGAEKSPAEEALIDDIAAHFAQELSYTNPRFDRSRFLRACGVRS